MFILFSIATLVFFLFNSAFPDPSQMVTGERTDEQTKAMINRELGLDQPALTRYVLYINDLSFIGTSSEDRGWKLFYWKDKRIALKWPYLRRSFQNGKEVSELILDSIPGTLVLAFTSMLLATVLGILMGVISGLFYGKWPDRLLMFLSTAGISLPSFFAAVLIAWIFGMLLHDITGLSMSGSLTDLDPFKGRIWVPKNLILPSIALGIRPLAVITQLTRGALKEELDKDYIRTARAKGLSEANVIGRHALRNAINPVITSASGWFASLLAGAFFVEYIFNWKGIGKLTIESLEKSDLPVVMGCVLWIALIFIFMNMFVDYLHKTIDPRIRAS